ncbi:MAG TPA: hypothetical protein PKJ33_04335 [Alphaproteobacteria bacterium]|nr:hypothetical protein [Alphaproteobacteria bacterium]
MREESGRSLIEVLGVLAISGILTAGAIAAYNTIRTRQNRIIATDQLELIAKNTKLLLEVKGDYTGVSVDYLIKAGALKNNKTPIGGSGWTITSSVDGKEFNINLVGLSKSDCAYLTTVKLNWTTAIRVNGSETNPGNFCAAGKNDVSLIVQ